MSRILILSSSPRRNGNSDLLCDRFAEGAGKAGHQVEKIRLAEKKIGYCTACYACRNGKCPQQDDAPEILEKMLTADVIVLATPVYFYTMCAQLKALLDRTVAIFPRLTDKKYYYIMTMAPRGPSERKNCSPARFPRLLRRLRRSRNDLRTRRLRKRRSPGTAGMGRGLPRRTPDLKRCERRAFRWKGFSRKD